MGVTSDDCHHWVIDTRATVDGYSYHVGDTVISTSIPGVEFDSDVSCPSTVGQTQVESTHTHTPVRARPKHGQHGQQVVLTVYRETGPSGLLQPMWVTPPDPWRLYHGSHIMTLQMTISPIMMIYADMCGHGLW